MEGIVIVCAGQCGKTTDDVSPYEFWKGELTQSNDPTCLVPVWTCRECYIKKLKNKLRDLEAE